MNEEATLRIPVTVDKSHIIALGERLYRESIEYNPGGLTVFRSVHVVKSGSSIDIIYSVAQPAEVTIRIFNLLGEIVKEWQGSVSANTENQWTWYGKNMYEQEVNNGVYICRINAIYSSGLSEEKIKLLAVAR